MTTKKPQAAPKTKKPKPPPAPPIKDVKMVDIPKQEESVDLNKTLQCGYLVGLKQDGSYMFEIFGSDKTLTNLLGVHKLAGANVKMEQDKKLLTGDAVTMQLGQLLTMINTKMDRLLSQIEKPQNEL